MDAELNDPEVAQLWAELSGCLLRPEDPQYPWQSYARGQVELQVERQELVPGKAWVFHNVFTEAECQNLIQLGERFGFGKIMGYPATYRNNTRFILKSEAFAQEMFARLKPLLPAVVSPDGKDLVALGNGDVQDKNSYQLQQTPSEDPAAADEARIDVETPAAEEQQQEEKELDDEQQQQVKPEEAQDEGAKDEGAKDEGAKDERGEERIREEIRARPWLLDGLNPHWRFCRYDRGGVFKRHLDGSFVDDALRRRSWYTCMLYLNSVRDGGATRFFERAFRPAEASSQSSDGGAAGPSWSSWLNKLKFWGNSSSSSGDNPESKVADQVNQSSDLQDWSQDDDDRVAGAPDLCWTVTASVPPGPGQVLVFYPDQWHDGERVRSDDLKHIVRTEIMFRR